MKKEIVVFDADTKQCQSLCKMLENYHYKATAVTATSDMEHYLQSSRCRIALINLDNLLVDKHFFRNLKSINPSVRLLGVSERSFHPELEEVISRHIFACLKKPVDPDELIFLLKSIFENNTNLENEATT
jgi:DNA-binding NtrC family response regulator